MNPLFNHRSSVLSLSFFIVFILSVVPALAGPDNTTYSLVRIDVSTVEDMQYLAASGVNLDHFEGSLARGIEVILSKEELEIVVRTGYAYEVLIQDWIADYNARPPATASQLQSARNLALEDNVGGFEYGSMGGFYTFDEVVTELDSMKLLYPSIITTKTSLGQSFEGREIWMMKISDNPDTDESATEAAIHYDALHHSREPASMSSTIYYMYWLLENYGIDDHATYLVDNREMYFVPVVNPDGYVYNQSTNPNGGGLWRKNRRDVDNSNCYGIDLNRNYGYEWGHNNGSSSNPCLDTYRGESEFSEPETQAVRDLLLDKNPAIAFTTHTYAERFLNPFGYAEIAPEYNVYSEFSSQFCSGSHYLYGITYEMLGYFSSGTTRDYLHSIGSYGWTPELGSSADGGFWPSQQNIIPIASENLSRFEYIAWVGGAFADFQNYELAGGASPQPGTDLDLVVTVKNRGLTMDATNVEVEVVSLYNEATVTTPLSTYNPIPPRSTADNSSNPITISISEDATYLDEINFEVTITQDGVETARDTLEMRIGNVIVLFEDNAEAGMSNWTTSGPGQDWDTTYVDAYDGTHSFADSRYGNANNSTNALMYLDTQIDLSNAQHPRVEYWAKWSIEYDYDYTRVYLSNNGGNPQALFGEHMITFQGFPSYMGTQHWVHESIDLTDYIGGVIDFEFQHFTDGGVPGDGFYFDQFRVIDVQEPDTSLPDISCVLDVNPSSGSGSFNYTMTMNNNTGITQPFDLWVTLEAPGITKTLFSKTGVSLAPFGEVNRSNNVNLPAAAPDQVYTVTLNLGTFPSEVTSSCSDTYTKIVTKEANAPRALDGELPQSTGLEHNYPNPFNPSTQIAARLAQPGHVVLKVFDILGREVITLEDNQLSAGFYNYQWNATNSAGERVSAGTYLYRMTFQPNTEDGTSGMREIFTGTMNYMP